MLSTSLALAQNQVVKGTISDAQGAYPIVGATVLVLDTDPIMGAVTDLEGKFRLEGGAHWETVFSRAICRLQEYNHPQCFSNNR